MIPEKPYWCCIACNGEYNIWYRFSRYIDSNLDTYVCTSCNFRIEKEKQWLLHRMAEPVGSHGILHTLVLATGSPQVESTVEKGQNQLEGQAAAIRDLCAQMAEHERVTSVRFQRLEDLLERVLASIAQIGPN